MFLASEISFEAGFYIQCTIVMLQKCQIEHRMNQKLNTKWTWFKFGSDLLLVKSKLLNDR